MNKSDYLKDVLETHKMSKIQTLVNKYNHYCPLKIANSSLK